MNVDLGPHLQYTIGTIAQETVLRFLSKLPRGSLAHRDDIVSQSTIFRYPGFTPPRDAITWTFHQSHSYLYSVWYLLANPINRVEVEFLPVYNPSPAEISDPELYAKNVQLVMAKNLNVEATDVTYAKYYEEYCRKTNTLLEEQVTKKKKSKAD